VFEYDYENQLTNVYVASAWKSVFQHDAFGRRRVRKEYGWQSSAWVLTNEVRYVYDGMLVVQERDWNNLALVSSIQNPASSPHSYYHADGNGNVTALVDTNGFIVARYQYDPYGNLLGMSGSLAEANLYRFSSKEWHSSAGLYYYGFRYYEPNSQRWLTRDPIQEIGGINLYAFVFNDPSRADSWGLDCWVLESTEGCNHQVFVGQNSDGSFWYSELMPENRGGLRTPNWKWLDLIGLRNIPLNCKAMDTTPKPWRDDPNNLPKDSEMRVKEHIKCSKSVDAKIKKYVTDTAKENTKWDAAGHNCKDYARDLAWAARAAKMREILDKKKDTKKQTQD
jgi:RHS repeat-associated protein